MAGDSGYYECGECHAAGDRESPIEHRDTCSVPEKIARSQREAALRREMEDRRKAEQYAYWDSFDDETLLVKLKQHRKIMDDQRMIWSALNDDFKQGLRAVTNRRILYKWLDG